LAEAVNRSVNEQRAITEEKTREDLRQILSQIAVIAFIGPSGTGKSTRAITVARKNNIAYMIDDGLLIMGSRIIAGSSAKKAASRLESVRQALFADETRAAVMRRALAEHHPAHSLDHQRLAEQMLNEWNLDETEIITGMARGAALDWQASLMQLLMT